MSSKFSTLVETAFEDLSQAMGPHGADEVMMFMETAFDLIDSDIDRPQEEKESLKAALVISSVAPYMESGLDLADLETRYNPLVAQTVEAVVSNQGNTLVGVDDANVVQLAMAYRCAIMSAAGDDMRIDLKGNADEVRMVRDEMDAIRTNPAVLSAPRLFARMEQTFEELAQAAGHSAKPDFGRIGVPRMPSVPSEVAPPSVPREPKGPSKPLRGPSIPRPPK